MLLYLDHNADDVVSKVKYMGLEEIHPLDALSFLPNKHKALIRSAMTALFMKIGIEDVKNVTMRNQIMDGMYPNRTVVLTIEEMNLILDCIDENNGEVSSALTEKLRDAKL